MSLVRNRYLVITLARLAGALAAAAGAVLMGRAAGMPQQIAALAIVIGGMGIMLFVPRALAARWASRRQP